MGCTTAQHSHIDTTKPILQSHIASQSARYQGTSISTRSPDRPFASLSVNWSSYSARRCHF